MQWNEAIEQRAEYNVRHGIMANATREIQSGDFRAAEAELIGEAHAEALTENAERATEVVHHVTRYGREISCGATGPVRIEEIAMRVNCPECKAADVAKLTAEAERQAYTEDSERHAAQTAGRARNSNWREQVYRRAVEMNAATPSMFDALISLVDEAHDEAKREDGERYAVGVIAGRVDTEDAEADDLIHLWDGTRDPSACGVDIWNTSYTFGSPELDEVTCQPCKDADRRQSADRIVSDVLADGRTLDQRKAAQIIAESRAPKYDMADAVPAPMTGIKILGILAPEDPDDEVAWAAYCAAMPEPTDAQIADVLAEYGDPYAAARAEAVAAFKDAARSIWKMRAANQTDTLAVDTIGSLRGSMRTLRDCIEIFDQLTESWQQEMRASAKRDSFTVKWADGVVTTVPYTGRRS